MTGKECYSSEKHDNWKKSEKNDPRNAFNMLYVKKWIYILPTFQNTTQIMKDQLFC